MIEGHGVDVVVTARDVGKPCGALVEDLAEKGEGAEHVGLVDANYVALAATRLAAAGDFEGGVAKFLCCRACDAQGFAGFTIADHFAAALGVEQALGRLAQDDEINLGGAFVEEAARGICEGFHRPDAGVKAELFAHAQVRRDLGAAGETDVGQAHGAEENGVGFARCFEGFRRAVLAAFFVILSATVTTRLDVEGESAERALELGEDREGRGENFLADTVAGQGRNLEARIGGGHRSCPFLIAVRAAPAWVPGFLRDWWWLSSAVRFFEFQDNVYVLGWTVVNADRMASAQLCREPGIMTTAMRDDLRGGANPERMRWRWTFGPMRVTPSRTTYGGCR